MTAGATITGDDEVLGAARLGAPWALTALYRELHPPLVRYLAVHASGEEEDLAVDVRIEIARDPAMSLRVEEARARIAAGDVDEANLVSYEEMMGRVDELRRR